MADKYKIMHEAPLLYRLANDLTRADAFEAPFIVNNIVARLEDLGMAFDETLVRGVYAKAKIKVSADELSECYEGSNTTSANWRDRITFVLDHGGGYMSDVERSDMELFSVRGCLDVYQLAKVEVLVKRVFQAWGDAEDAADEAQEAAAARDAARDEREPLVAGSKRRGRRPKQMTLAI